MNIFRCEPNQPAQVALERTDGVNIQGRYGDRVMYTLMDGRVLYVPPIVASQIQKQNICAGARFEICKTVVPEGSRRSLKWTARKLEPGSESGLEQDLRASVAIAEAKNGTPESAEGPGPVLVRASELPPPPPKSNGASNGALNGHTGAHTEAPATPTTKLEHALKTAISAAYNAEKYGTELGYVVRFDADAIKSMAITVLINMSDGGRR